jgi:uncharacterized protein YaiI (UPF0178 family)
MKILVDADSCPRHVRELVLKRAKKLKTRIIFAANRKILESSEAEMEICPNRENSADDRIVELAEKGDVAVTRDVPLAKRLVEKSVSVIDDRGRVFTSDNINELLSIRNFKVSLANNGLETDRTANYGKKDLKSFADALDRTLTSILRLQGTDSEYV